MTQIISVILGGLLFVSFSFWYEIGNLTEDVSDKSNTITLQKITIYDLNESLNKQNKNIDDIKVDYEAKILEFKKLPRVKYVTKYITKEINVIRSDCSDTKSLLFELRRIGID